MPTADRAVRRRGAALRLLGHVPDELLPGLYAGAEISYGKFVKTVHDQRLIYRGDWADPIRLH